MNLLKSLTSPIQDPLQTQSDAIAGNPASTPLLSELGEFSDELARSGAGVAGDTPLADITTETGELAAAEYTSDSELELPPGNDLPLETGKALPLAGNLAPIGLPVVALTAAAQASEAEPHGLPPAKSAPQTAEQAAPHAIRQSGEAVAFQSTDKASRVSTAQREALALVGSKEAGLAETLAAKPHLSLRSAAIPAGQQHAGQEPIGSTQARPAHPALTHQGLTHQGRIELTLPIEDGLPVALLREAKNPAIQEGQRALMRGIASKGAMAAEGEGSSSAQTLLPAATSASAAATAPQPLPVDAPRATAQGMLGAEPAAPLLNSGSTSGLTSGPTSGPTSGQPQAATAQRHDFEQVIERLSEARELARPGRADLQVNHREFGQVSMQFDLAGPSLKVALASANAAFAPAVQAALADGARGDVVASRQDVPAQQANTSQAQTQGQNLGQAQGQSTNLDAQAQRQQEQSQQSRQSNPSDASTAERDENSDQNTPQTTTGRRDNKLFA